MAKGDHLSVRRGWYTHHAIDLGDGYVVQYGRGVSAGARAAVHVCPYERFSKGRRIERVASPVSYDADEVALRALGCVGERGYHILWNNCEHFVTWCRNGKRESHQADRFIQTASEIVSKVCRWPSGHGCGQTGAQSFVQTLNQSGEQSAHNTLAACRGWRSIDRTSDGLCFRTR